MPLDIMDDKSITPPHENIFQLFAEDALDVISHLKDKIAVNEKHKTDIGITRPGSY